MDFDWSEEQRLWRQAVRDFPTRNRPRVRQIDTERIPVGIIGNGWTGPARAGLF
jgi:hypothetical protein